jgi:small subunit ribosomal protein S16
MATKIRLQRHGRKKRAFFHIVVADSRAPRDGRFIEKIGTYNPITNPATIDINLDKAVQWMQNGAQPTDTARAILSYKGVLYKRHLQIGVLKGALTQEQADAKFAEWIESKDSKVNAKRDSLAQAKNSKKADALKAETKKRADIAAKVLAKNSVLSEEVSSEEVENTEETVETAENTHVEEVSAEEGSVEETPAVEETATEEAPAEEPASEETPAEEPEAPAAEEEKPE